MRGSPAVSVGLPVHNGARYLSEALDCVLDQTYGDFELIISDNASTDATSDICQDYAKRDERIRYVRSNVNQGAAWNFNRVFELSRAPYFKWINHDDRWDPLMLERSVEVLDEAPADVVLCYPRTTFIDEQGSVIREYEDDLDLRSSEPARRLGELIRNLRRCNAIFGLMRAERLSRTRLLGGYIDADRTLLAELSMLGQFWEMDERLFFRRMHPEGSTFANVKRADSMAWWNPSVRQRVHLPNWRLLTEHVRAVRNTPLTSRERRGCYASLARSWMAVYRGNMVGDVKATAYRLGRQLSNGVSPDGAFRSRG